jgi:hypothetical protein
VCLPIAPHILLSAQVHLATVTHAQQQIVSPLWLRPVWFHQNCQKNSRKYRKKIVNVFACFSKIVLYFCRPHPTSIVGANFCVRIFFYPCSEKKIKKIEKKFKILIPTRAFRKNLGKIQEKGKIQAICLFCEFFPSSFVFTLLRYVSTRLSQHL